MPETIVERFEVKLLSILDESGNADSSLMPPISEDLIKKFFETLIFARTFNSRAISLQREGRIGTYASIYGQEASQIGSALALEKDDWVFPSFRETAVNLTLGYPAWLMFRYWAGDERGMKCPEGLNIFPMSVPVGTQITHAVGASLAMKLKGAKSAAVCYFGDGGSSRGDLHEGFNMAGVLKTPTIFICQNNQWAISVPRERQTASRTIAQKAFSYGFEGMQVDGNDVFAVYKATKDALDKAKAGGGPTFIECLTYRLDDHTTSDDASRYRKKENVEAWEAKEPMIRLRLFMRKKGMWSEAYEESIMKKATEAIDSAITEEETFRPSEPKDIIAFTNAELSQRQIKELKDRGWQG